ncbi:MAG: hypothetical protein LBG87_06320 [Spirochaetaceae bacterium]|nr:hypothetical protein [Spirochaetaceae bacterium]
MTVNKLKLYLDTLVVSYLTSRFSQGGTARLSGETARGRNCRRAAGEKFQRDSSISSSSLMVL